MDVHFGSQDDQNEDYRWLLREASWREFWLALDQTVDWVKRREQIEELRLKKKKNRSTENRDKK